MRAGRKRSEHRGKVLGFRRDLRRREEWVLASDELDRITLTGIRAFGHHGVLPHERTYGQQFIADVTLFADLNQAGRSDQLADTVDYSEIAAAVSEELAGSPLDTIEALAHRIAERCLTEDPIRQVTVTVHKPMAPVSVVLDDIAVTITRSNR